MGSQVVIVPLKGRRILISADRKKEIFSLLGLRKKKKKEKPPVQRIIEFVEPIPGPEVLGIMGGPYQNLFIRLARIFPVKRVPWFQLERLADLNPKASPEEQVKAIEKVWKEYPDVFYPLEPLESILFKIRQLTRIRLGIQDIFRKPAQLQYKSTIRDLEILLPERIIRILEEAEELPENIEDLFNEIEEMMGEELPKEDKEIIEMRVSFSNPRFIKAAKEDEKEDEERILDLLKQVPIWPYLHSKNSGLPQIKGLAASLAGSIISETGDIRRFPTWKDYRAYARFHLKNGNFPKRKLREPSSWNWYLNRAVWFWSNDQVPRYNHFWKEIYLYKKALEMRNHPEVVPREITDKRGRKRTVWDYTLKHLDSRAKRWVGSQFLRYYFDLATVLMVKEEDPEIWYPDSRWPGFFERIEHELKAGLRSYLEAEIPKRRRQVPEAST